MEISGYTSSQQGRTAGAGHSEYKSIQSWKSKSTTAAKVETESAGVAQNQIMANLDKAAMGKIGSFDFELETGFAYANTAPNITPTPPSGEGYGFADIIDVVNPLHHLPLVGMAYRGLTGDGIHPMSQIIGGAIYGGPIGAVTGTANAIAQVQSGKDLSDHALSMVGLQSESQQFSDVNFNVNQAETRTAGQDALTVDHTQTTNQAVDPYKIRAYEAVTEMDIAAIPAHQTI